VPTADRPTTPGETRFWELAEPFLTRSEVTRSTMMGYPCLRVHGQYFASTHHRTGDLVVKLPEARVDELVGQGRAERFSPDGRPFREWAAVPFTRSRSWKALLAEAHDFVADLPSRPPRRRRAAP
jgi:hypothetical protein